ncbi:MAG: YbaB/EbfC family nucleoid-associated protein [Gemmatimonadota bacterium]|nr:MAG: YbaB/EbfC family nucleoid-associated protein [Gemmatimonadota bacterium]
MNNLQQLFQLVQQGQARLTEIQTQLASKTVTASSGGGLVKVVADGQGRIREIKIDPSVVDPSDTEMLEDLLQAAVSEVQARARQLYEEEISRMAGGLAPFNLGGLFGGL